jgi:hypothetical protein
MSYPPKAAMTIPVEIMKAGVDNSIDRPPIFRPKSFKSLLNRFVRRRTFLGLSKLCSSLLSEQQEEHDKNLAKQPPDIVAITSMLISLKSDVENSHPLQFPSVFLSLPNFVAPDQQIYKERFISVAELADLKPSQAVTYWQLTPA